MVPGDKSAKFMWKLAGDLPTYGIGLCMKNSQFTAGFGNMLPLTWYPSSIAGHF